jgi:hypothetical protein
VLIVGAVAVGIVHFEVYPVLLMPASPIPPILPSISLSTIRLAAEPQFFAGAGV